MMKQNYKRIIFIFCLLIVSMYIFNVVHADINWEYYKQSITGMQVADANLDSKVGGSSLLSAIGLLIYSVGSLLEWVLGGMYQLITSTNIFPWADAILFNALPLLDVNFINPASNHGNVSTLVGKLTVFLKNTYATLFGLAFTFFSIAVLIMAIKLVISTIASEKAKYKQALTQWFIGLLLLFTIHYGISFIFYLNESLVNLASEMVRPSLTKASTQIKKMNETDSTEATNAVNAFIDSMESVKITDILHLGINRLTTSYKMVYLGNDYNKACEYIKKYPEITVSLLQNEGYTNWRFGEKDWYNFKASSSDKFWTWSAGDKCFVKIVADNVYVIVNNGKLIESSYTSSMNKLNNKIKNGTATKDEKAQYEFYNCVVNVYKEHIKGEELGNSVSIISNLANFFKEASWAMGNNSWRADSVVIQYALLYSILVVQSLILFIAYCKRLFYVIILALMAPIVVVFDFFNKSIG